MPEILTVADLTHLTVIAEAVQSNWPIKWTPDEGETILTGRCRCFCDERMGFVSSNPNLDVRDAYVRVTGGTGAEHLLPVRDLMAWQRTGAVSFRGL